MSVDGAASTPPDRTKQREVLANLLRARAGCATEFPLSRSQEIIWLHSATFPDSSAYNIPLAFRIKSALDASVVRASLANVIERHPVMRSVVFERDGVPFQRITTPESLKLEESYEAACENIDALIGRLTQEHAREPFDLSVGPLYRFHLIHFSDSDHLLLATIHHLVLDGWSIGVFLNDFTECYLALAAGRRPALPPIREGFLEHLSAQPQGTVGTDNEYWVERFKGYSGVLPLPYDRLPTAQTSHRGSSCSIDIPTDVLAGLRNLARREGVTLFMVMLTAYYLLIGRMTGRTDIVLAVSIAGREKSEHWSAIGPFSHILPMRADLTGCSRVVDFLRRVRDSAIEDYAHSDLSLISLAETIAAVRNGRREALFQLGFDFQNTPWPTVAGEEEINVADYVTLLVGDSSSAKIDLNLDIREELGRLRCTFEFATDLFDLETVTSIAESYAELARSFQEQASVALESIELVGSRRRALLREWSHALPARERELNCCTQRILQIAKDHPHRIAFEGPSGLCTYGEFAYLVRRIAHGLLAAGTESEERIGLCMPRSIEQWISVFGIMASGGCFVPLDPDLPLSRIAEIVASSGIRLVLVDSPDRVLLPSETRHLSYQNLIANAPDGELAIPSANQLAYVTHTSGTTGRPKGVPICRGALLDFAVAAAEAFGLTADDRVLQFASLAFDASVEEVFPALVSGATVVLRREDMFGSAQRFAKACDDLRLSVMNLPTAFWREWVSGLADEPVCPCPSLRAMIIGGEAAQGASVVEWQRIFKQARLLNTYGPSEATVTVTCAELDTPPEDGRPVSIGRPFGVARVYVLDAHLNPVAPGMEGEIFIGGPCLARGYWDDPVLTAKCFLPDPLNDEPGARMYRTGDLGRFRADGSLEFRGRRDSQQVKVRGFRIELGEIEVVLCSHPHVKSAAVVVDKDTGEQGDGLIAVAVTEPGHRLSPKTIVEWLSERLPKYMVPWRVLLLDRIPLTISGKVDRRALLANLPELDRPTASATAPRTPTESVLAQIWAEVLGLDSVQLDDDFFQLGGHSLMMTRVLARVNRAFRVDVPVQRFFAASKLAAFASIVERERVAATYTEKLPIERTLTDGSWPQSFEQRRLWFLERLSPGDTYNQSSATRLRGNVDVDAMSKAIAGIVERHEILRTAFLEIDGEPIQQLTSCETPELRRVDLSHLPVPQRQTQLAATLSTMASEPFDLTMPPLLRMCLIQIDAEEFLLQTCLHHIVSDAWSAGILAREFAELYAAHVQGLNAELPDLALRYADYASWQQAYFIGANAARLTSYWSEKLANLPDPPLLPERPGAHRVSNAGQSCWYLLEPSVAKAIQGYCRSRATTPYMFFLTAFYALLSKYSGQTDLAIGTPFTTRDSEELERLVGFFVNMVVLRSDVSGDPSFEGLLERVRDVVIDAHAYRAHPFDKLVGEIRATTGRGADSLVKVVFSFHDQAPLPPALFGVEANQIDIPVRSVKFDLTLEVVPRHGTWLLVFYYSSDLFETSTITRMLSHYQGLVAAVLEDPSRRLSQLRLLSSSEHDDLRQWGEGRKGEVVGTVLSWFDALVLSDAGSPALVEDGETVSYGSLHTRSLRLAQTLAARGVGESGIVGLALSGLVDRVTAMLASWRLGAAFLPLDLSHPQARLHWMLEDAGAVMVLARGDIGWDKSRTLDLYGIQWPEGAMAVVPAVDLPAGLLAYVIYTSGSSGRPKCVEIDHSGLANLVVWHNRTFAVDKTSMASQLAGPAFDASLWEIWPYLSAGGTVSAVPAEIRVNPEALILWLSAHGMTHAFMPTPLGEACLDEPWPESTRLKTLLVGGDVLHRRPRSGLPFRLYNAYGPTEGTVVSTCDEVLSDEIGLPPIGRPIDNVRVYVLDAHGEPVPIGVAGELCIAGRGLARGYRGDEQRTAEQFVEHGEFAGGRVYRSGDRARFRADGRLEFLGRLDAQIKLRGMRIEPGEIEAELLAIEGVRRAVVVLDTFGGRDPQLVAYLEWASAEGGQADCNTDLRTKLKGRLPAPMVPSHIVSVERVPQTANGKIDLRQLKAVNRENNLSANLVPVGDAETLVAEIWTKLLGAASIHPQSDFFDLGGHSILAAKIATRLERILRIHVPLQLMFDHRTLREFVTALAERVGGRTRLEHIAGIYKRIESMSTAEARATLGDGDMSLAELQDTGR